MIFPNNGKVAIIDDQPDEIKYLLLALTKERMPFLFFSDREGVDLPEIDKPLENIRLLFLDLDLGLSNGTDPKTKVRFVQERIIRIIKPKTPYVLVIWSNHEDQLYQYLENEFNNGFSDYKPVFKCSLDKTQIKNPKADIVAIIRENLKTVLKPFESFNAFLLWEALVNKSSGDVVNSFVRIFEIDEHWDLKTRAFFHKIAAASAGDAISDLKDHSKLRLALEAINSALIDFVEKEISSQVGNLNLEITSRGSGSITPKNLISINTKLHVLKSHKLNHYHPGNIYLTEMVDEKTVEEIIVASFNKENVKEVLADEIKRVWIDLTPSCDYSQRKGYVRLLTGILLKGAHRGKIKTPQAFIYKESPVFELLDGEYFLLFDFRYSKSFKVETIEKIFERPTYRMRSSFVNDLQAQWSNHINRPGLLTIK